MAEDRRLFQRNPQTKRYNVVSLPRSGAFGHRKVIDKAFVVGDAVCPCNNGIGCSIVHDPNRPNPCDIIVMPCEDTSTTTSA